MRNRSRLTWGAIAAVVIAAVYVAWTAFAPAQRALPRLLVNEVLYLPAVDRPAFVEIFNPARAATNLDGVSLRNEKGASFPLPSGTSLEAGAFVVVRFDGLTGSEGGVVHAPVDAFPGGDRSAIWLNTSEGTVDGVAWGVNRPAAVELCRGGRCADPVPGSVVARVPGERTALTTTAWAPLDPDNATPGEPNPLPPVATFAALSGAIYGGKPRFSWYSVPGAVRYRVEVATDETFAHRVHEADVTATPLDVLQELTATGPELPPGDYFWRVQAVGVRSDTAAFSRPVAFSVRANRRVPGSAYTFGLIDNAYADTNATSAGDAADPSAICVSVLSSYDDAICKELAVPVIVHQKDTLMLTLEAPSEEPPWGWDKPDVAGYPYCARAGVAMVNAYYRAKLGVVGTLSQDRIGFEVYEGLLEYGPEYDLPVVGITNLNTDKYSLPLALGTSGNYHPSPTPFESDERLCAIRNRTLRCGDTGCPQCPPQVTYPWGYRALNDIKTEIDADRPLIVTGPGHLYLIVGYVTKGGGIYSIITQDEGGRVEVSLQHNGEEETDWVDGHNVSTSLDGNEAVSLQVMLDSYWTELIPVKLGSDEASISADSDHDGVVDFDEEKRFATFPTEPDSDHDGVNDKEEIHYSVWDPDHGYHKTVTQLPSTSGDSAIINAANSAQRDPMELDPDSDDGGCTDGKEDANHNGVRDSGETSNFVKEDDRCEPEPIWTGTMHSIFQAGADGETTEVSVRLRETRINNLPHPPLAKGMIDGISLVDAGSVITRTYWTDRARSPRDFQSGHGTSPAKSPAGEILRVIEEIGADGEPRWSESYYVLGLAPGVSLPFTQTRWTGYETITETREASIGSRSVNTLPSGDQPRSNTFDERHAPLVDGQMIGSYNDSTNRVSWSICREGTPCAPLPPLPETAAAP